MNSFQLKSLLSIIILFAASIVIYARSDSDNLTALLTGASFASPQNTWFEQGCKELDIIPINKAIGGESITETANRMYDGTLYTLEELEEIDFFVIMQVHNRDVFNGYNFKTDYNLYKLPFEKRVDYAEAFDYVIKKYIADCYNLKDNPNSKYYKRSNGKPATIVLCTDWHDARETYNNSIRQLSSKWGLPLVEFDINIGFSRKSVHPVTGKQQSLEYASDTQTINGIEYGWHPIRGEEAYIQKKMARIFANKMKQLIVK